MSDTHFREEHDLFRKSFREFVERELAPHADEWEKAEEFPREVFSRMGKLGYLGLRFPEDVGGAGGDYWYTVAYAEEFPRSRSAGLNMSIMVQTDMATPIIGELGTREQKEEFLVPAIQGEKIAALGVTEPGAGSDVAGIRTTARRVGGDFVINGAKTFITNGTRADFITLAVRTGPEGYGGLSLVLFPTDTKGFRVARKLKKIGNHASDTAELAFDDCRIPVRYLLGEENQGFFYIMMNFQGERLIAAMASRAGAELCLHDAIRYGQERTAFGRPIGKFQVWRHQFVDLATELEAGKWLCYRAADLYDRKQEATREISMAKLYCGELAVRAIDRCLQFYGGYGYVEEFPIARAWRDVRLITIGGGTSEIMKEIIAKRMGIG
ncbi:MAG: acyl-CoA dehydrogenase family protein [Myxococcota bacterium]